MDMVIFGSTGDLARKKLFPALRKLKERYDIRIIAIGRRFESGEEFRREMGIDAEYIRADITRDKIDLSLGDAIIYFALSPELYPHAIEQAKNIRAVKKRVIIEKPFGYDYESAKRYYDMLLKAFDKEEIYFIDHYLGKAFIQNLLVLRMKNDILRGIWNSRFIDHIQVIVDENEGIEKRMSFYNKVGAIKDMLQNHIMQIISLILMEEPMEEGQSHYSYEKIRVLKSLEVKDVVRAKYMEKLERESFVAVKFESSLFNYRGMPIYVRTGKMMEKKQALIYIQFRGIYGNSLLISIQPEMKMEFVMNVRSFDGFRKVRMEYNHGKTIGMNTPDAYEYLIEKAILGDRLYFPTIDEILEAWKVAEKVERKASESGEILLSKGMPEQAIEMVEKDGRQWVA